MKLEVINKYSLKSPDYAAAIFPGAVKLANGELLMHFCAGSGFESSDQNCVQARSADNGRTWQTEQCIADVDCLKSAEPFTFCSKPTLLSDGSLISAGYGFFRDRPDMGLSDYAGEYKRFPKIKNYALFSNDCGKSWSAPHEIEHQYNGLEISGPVLAGSDGKLRIFATPFELNAKVNLGITLISSDSGKSWQEAGRFFASGDIAPWEVRSIELASGRIMLVFWAFDLKNQQHLNNHVVFSDDGGESWSEPIDTGLRGQASNWLMIDGKAAILQARREGKKTGLYLNIIEDFDGSRFTFSQDICLWDASGKANSGSRIEEQFASLKFGQPSALELADGSYLFCFWHQVNGEYTVQCWQTARLR